MQRFIRLGLGSISATASVIDIPTPSAKSSTLSCVNELDVISQYPSDSSIDHLFLQNPNLPGVTFSTPCSNYTHEPYNNQFLNPFTQVGNPSVLNTITPLAPPSSSDFTFCMPGLNLNPAPFGGCTSPIFRQPASYERVFGEDIPNALEEPCNPFFNASATNTTAPLSSIPVSNYKDGVSERQSVNDHQVPTELTPRATSQSLNINPSLQKPQTGKPPSRVGNRGARTARCNRF